MATKKIVSDNYVITASTVDIDAANLRANNNVYLNYSNSNSSTLMYFGSSNLALLPAIRWNPDADGKFQWSIYGNSLDANDWINFGGFYANGVTVASASGSVFDEIDVTRDAYIGNVIANSYLLANGINPPNPLLAWSDKGVLFSNPDVPNTFTSNNRFYYDQANNETLYVPNINIPGNATIVGHSNLGEVVVLGNLQVRGNTTFVDVTVDTISNAYIVLAANSNTISQADTGGFVIVTSNIGATPNISFQYNYISNAMVLNYDQIIQSGLSVTGNIVGNNIRSNNNTYSTRYFYNDGANLVSGTSGEVQYSNAAARLTSSNTFVYDEANTTLRVVGTISAGSNNVISNNQGVFSAGYYYSNGQPLQDRTNVANTRVVYSNGTGLEGSTDFAWQRDTSNLVINGNINLTRNIFANSSTSLIYSQSNVISNVFQANLLVLGNTTANTRNLIESNTRAQIDGNLVVGNVAVAGNTTGLAAVFAGNVQAAAVKADLFVYANTDTNITGGSNTNIQYNLNGRFAGSNAFVFDPAANTITVAGNIVSDGFIFANGTPVGTGSGTGSGTPGGANNSIQYNLQGQFAGAPGFSYDLSSGTVTNQGNISAVSRTSSLGEFTVSDFDTVIETLNSNTQGITGPVWTGSKFLALELPIGNVSSLALPGLSIANSVISNAGATFYANVRFLANTAFYNAVAIPVGSNVTVSGVTDPAYNQSNITVVNSGLGWANLRYVSGGISNITSASGTVFTPSYMLSSIDGNTWVRGTQLRPGYLSNKPQRLLKIVDQTNLVYTVLYNALTSTWDTWRSSDEGTTWSFATASTNLPTANLLYDFSISAGNTLMVVGSNNTSYAGAVASRSTDFGNTYTANNPPVTGLVTVAAGIGNRWLSLSRGAGEIVSVDDGNTWANLRTKTTYLPPADNARDLTVPLIYDIAANSWIWSNVDISNNTAVISYTSSNGAQVLDLVGSYTFDTTGDYRNGAISDLISDGGRLTVLEYKPSANASSRVRIFSNIFVSAANTAYDTEQLTLTAAYDPALGRMSFLRYRTGTAATSATLLSAAAGNIYGGNVITSSVYASGNVTASLTVTADSLIANTANIPLANINNTARIGNVRTDNLLYANGLPWVFTSSPAGSNLQIQYNLGGNLAGSALTYDPVSNRVSIPARLDVDGPANLNLGGGTPGQMLGYSQLGVLSFVDRVVKGNINAGTNTPTGAQITAALPFGTILVDGTLFLDTNTNPVNTQSLYIYINGSWRQIMTSSGL